ncbi:MAG: TatD family hydrolase, partial [Planctomycetota bacterium]|jgi:TatD DNase family protein
MELIDTHCHLTFEDLACDVAAVVERSRAAGVTGWITVGTDPEHNQKCVELAEKYEGMYAAVAVHPHDAKTVTDETLAKLRDLARHPKVVAIGETGLDYHYNHSLHEEQRRVFAEHLKIAAELDLPVIIHCRKAFDETTEILRQHGQNVQKVVFHCFSGSAEQAKIVLDRGYYVSFTGVVTFKNAEKTRKAAVVVPIDRLMLETDCPYMSPEPMRKQQIDSWPS